MRPIREQLQKLRDAPPAWRPLGPAVNGWRRWERRSDGLRIIVGPDGDAATLRDPSGFPILEPYNGSD